MTKQEQILYDALLSTFAGNMRFLSQYDKPLFERVDLLSNVIGSGHYQERFFLEFIKEDGEFDVFDSSTQTYLYGKKGKSWNNKAVVNTNFDLNGSIGLLNPDIYYTNNLNLSDQNMDDYFTLYNLRTANDYKQIMSVIPTDITTKAKKVKQIDKFLFVGTLLGRHIPKILKKINSKNHFVCETNLELFRLSLFVTDYSLLARDGRSVVFSIMDDEEHFLERFKLFYLNDISSNVFFKYYSTDRDVAKMFDLMLSVIFSFDSFGFNYNALLYGAIEVVTRNMSNIRTINLSKAKSLFIGKKVLFLGAGPSLSKNIKWIFENQNKFIIIAMAATLKRLHKHNIKPDIIVSFDPQQFIAKSHYEVDEEIIQDSIKLIAANSHQKLVDRLKIYQTDESLFLYESMVSFLENNIAISGKSIGEATLSMLLLLGAKEIFMLGTDLALDQVTGASHDDLHNTKTKYDIDTAKDLSSKTRQSFTLKDDLVEVNGNLCEKVITSRFFYASIIEYNNAIQRFKDNSANIYNMCEQGAYISGAIPTRIKDLELSHFENLDKTSLRKDLKNSFHRVSQYGLNSLEQENIKKQINLLEELKLSLDKVYEVNDFNEFKESTKHLFKLFYIEGDSLFFSEIFFNYYFIVNRYINFYYNDKEIKNESKTIKEIAYIWGKQVEYLIDKYISFMKKLS